MVDAAFAKGRIQRLPQLLQRQIRGVEAGNGNLLQRFGQALQPVPPRQPLDGPKLFAAGVHLLLQVGAVAVHGPVHRAEHLPLHAQIFHLHHRLMRAHGGQKGDDLVGLL